MTAVEFLVETLDQNHAIIMNYVDLQKLIEKAKAMEKEQIMVQTLKYVKNVT